MISKQRLVFFNSLVKTGLVISVICMSGCNAKMKYMRQLSVDDVSEKRQAIEALGLMGNKAKGATDKLIEIVRLDGDAETRRLAIDALGCIQPPLTAELTDAFVLALNDQNPEIRRAAVVAVSRFNNFPSNILTILQKHLADSDNLVRELIMSTFERIGNLGLRSLLSALRDPDDQMRLYAIVTIGRLGEYAESAKHTLREIEGSDKSYDVRRAASEALRVISQ